MATTHQYHSHLAWAGSTGAGYRDYPRGHRVVTPPANAELAVSADPSFAGDPSRHNPEQLLLAAASSCQLLSFLALAAYAQIDVVRYEDDAEAVMPATTDRMRITAVILRPRIVVAVGTDLARVADLVAAGHEACYIANTLTAEVTVEPAVEHADNTVTSGQARTAGG